MELYEVNFDQMVIIARHFRWNADRINDAWFANSHKLQYTLGLKPAPEMKKNVAISSSLLLNNKSWTCLICYE